MEQTLTTEPEVVEEAPPRRRPPGGLATTVVLLCVVLMFLLWAGLSFLELDTSRYTSALVALTQYAVPVGAVLVVLGLVLRRWLTALVVGLVTAALVFSVAPRAVPDSPAPVTGQPIRVLTSNMYFGQANAQQIVDIVRRERVDVLSLQELDPEAVAALDQAGLGDLLPHRVFKAAERGAGTGIASRYPLQELSLMPRTTLRQPSALIDLPGRDVELVAVHPIIPVGVDTVGDWQRELTALPEPTGEDAKTARVLAGDFNATLDHTPLQAQLGKGYRDAGEITGNGLHPTWPRMSWAPPVTIDHVLVSGGVAVQDYRLFDIQGSDHRAILAHLVVPHA